MRKDSQIKNLTADKDYWRECYQTAHESLTSVRAWMKGNAPDVWLRYEQWRLGKYIVCQTCNATPCRCPLVIESKEKTPSMYFENDHFLTRQ